HMPPPPTSPLFPYTTLFRSKRTLLRRRRRLGRRRSGRRLPASLHRRRLLIAVVGLLDCSHRAGEHHPCPAFAEACEERDNHEERDRKSTRLNSSHLVISYAV